MERVFEARGLTKFFGGLGAVDDLSFHIEKGKIISIIGPNGAGKTTVFNLITGIFSPTRGNVIFMNEDITGFKPFSIARRGIARTFQLTTVFPQDTVLDNLVIGYRLRTGAGIFGAVFRSKRYGTDEGLCLGKAQEIMEITDLGRYAHEIAANIPQEAQKRLSIGIALATNPTLLLLDEPAGGVNLEEIGHLARLIKEINDLGVSICLIEHKMRMVMDISHRVIVLHHGRKIAEGAPGEVSQDENVIQAYLGSGYAA